jgi:hypothetical protein
LNEQLDVRFEQFKITFLNEMDEKRKTFLKREQEFVEKVKFSKLDRQAFRNLERVNNN